MSAKDFHFEGTVQARAACVSPEDADSVAPSNNSHRPVPLPNEAFENVTRLVAKALDVPIVLLSLIDEDHQYLLSQVGWDIAQTVSTSSFCAHTVRQSEPFIVSDTTVDIRFANDRLVIGKPRIRSYLGVPVSSRGGHPIGTLCAIDRRTRDFGIDHVKSLEEFARLIEIILDTQIAVIKDLSDRKRLENDLMTLREAQSRLQTITANVPALIGYWNRELRCEYVSESYRHWDPGAAQDMIGKTMSDLMGDRLFQLNEPHARAALCGDPQHFERKLVKADGTEMHLEARYVPDVDERGQIRGFVVLVTDITTLRQAQLALEAANAQLKLDSVTDYLTGLSNRKVFSERSEDALQGYKVNGEPYGLILLDLDDFKSINDEFGHAVGDEVLRAVGRVLKESLRGIRDIAARLGGEEFAVLCFGTLTQDSLHQITERIRAAVQSERLDAIEGAVIVTSSFGIALSHPEDADWKSIYGRADEALYRAKVGGKNRIELGSVDVKDASGRHRLLRPRRP